LLEIIILGAGAGFLLGFLVGGIIWGVSDGNIMGVILGVFCAPVGVIIAIIVARSVRDSIKNDFARDELAFKQLVDKIVLPNLRLLVLCVGGALVLSFILTTILYMNSIDFEMSSWVTERWWSRQIREWSNHLILAVLFGWLAFRYILGRSQDYPKDPGST
jgi:hypothetical protein